MNAKVLFENPQELENGKTLFNVGSVQTGELIGEISIRQRNNEFLEIGGIVIDDEWRHNGYAEEVTAQVILAGMMYGYRKFRTSTNNPYLSSIMLNKFGFGLRVGHMLRSNRPIHVWEKNYVDELATYSDEFSTDDSVMPEWKLAFSEAHMVIEMVDECPYSE